MFNPITIVQTILKWFANLFKGITSFSWMKLFFVGFFLFTIGWYYIQSYDTPIYNVGHSIKLIASEPIDYGNKPHFSLYYNLNYTHFYYDENSLERSSTEYLCDIINNKSHLSILKNDISLKKSDTIICKISDDKDFMKFYKQDDTTQYYWYGAKIMTLIPNQQPIFFKNNYSELRSGQFNKSSNHINIPITSEKFEDDITLCDYFVKINNNFESRIDIKSYCFRYDIKPIPQWRCNGNLSTFILKFNTEDIKTKLNRQNEDILPCIYDIVSFDFHDYIQISTMHPYPDSIWSTGFAWTNPDKIKIININGIDGFCKYPSKESWQIVRTFVLTTLLATLLSLFLGLLYNLLNKFPKFKNSLIILLYTITINLITYYIIKTGFHPCRIAYINNNIIKLVFYFTTLIIYCIITRNFTKYMCEKYKLSFLLYILTIVVVFIFIFASYGLLYSNPLKFSNIDKYILIITVMMLYMATVLSPIMDFVKKNTYGFILGNKYYKIFHKNLALTILKNRFKYFPNVFIAYITQVFSVIIISIPFAIFSVFFEKQIANEQLFLLIGIVISLCFCVIFMKYIPNKFGKLKSKKTKQICYKIFKGTYVMHIAWIFAILFVDVMIILLEDNFIAAIEYIILFFILFTPSWYVYRYDVYKKIRRRRWQKNIKQLRRYFRMRFTIVN